MTILIPFPTVANHRKRAVRCHGLFKFCTSVQAHFSYDVLDEISMKVGPMVMEPSKSLKWNYIWTK